MSGGGSEIHTMVDIENHRAIKLYEKLGFEKKRGSISHVWTV